MSNKLNKILSYICIAAFCVTLLSTVSSATHPPQPSMYSYYEIKAGLVPGLTVSSTTPEARNTSSNNIVCVMRIYSDPGSDDSSSNSDFGHAFLTFLNASSSDITVGRFTVGAGKMISVGKFGNFGEYANNFKGVFYNVEAQRKENRGWYGASKSIYMELTANELQTVSNYIISRQSGYSEVGNNCATLAAGAWNSVLSLNNSKYISHTGTPALVYQDIENIGAYVTGNGLIRADYDRCYYNGSTRVSCGDRHII